MLTTESEMIYRPLLDEPYTSTYNKCRNNINNGESDFLIDIKFSALEETCTELL
jgi:hypothetical protein